MCWGMIECGMSCEVVWGEGKAKEELRSRYVKGTICSTCTGVVPYLPLLLYCEYVGLMRVTVYVFSLNIFSIFCVKVVIVNQS